MSMLSRLLQRTSDELVIAPLRRRDLGEVMAIERVSYPRPWTESVFRGELDLVRAGTRCYLAARQRGPLVGYAGVMFVVDEAHVTNIAVARNAQRQGVGRRLLAELAWAAVAHGSTGLTLEVRDSNVAAQAMYERFGFVSVGVRQRYYENTDDAVVMWLEGIQQPSFAERLNDWCPEAGR